MHNQVLYTLIISSDINPFINPFIKAYLNAKFTSEKARLDFLTFAIPYALAFNQHLAAILCSALLKQKHDAIPTRHYELARDSLEDIAKENPDLKLDLSQVFLAKPTVSEDFSNAFFALSRTIKRELILWAILDNQEIPRKYQQLQKLLLTHCIQANDELRQTVRILLDSCQRDELLQLIEHLLASLEDKSISQERLVYAIFGNPILKKLLADKREY